MNERGNVMFYILIAVALLAALIFAVGQSGRGSIQQVNDEKAKLLASEIIEYANNVSTAFAQLRLRGCKLEEMSFENDTIGGYANASAPTDRTCNIFDPAGGGITFIGPPVQALDGVSTMPLFTIELEIDGVSTTCGNSGCSDMVMVSGPLLQNVCVQLNNSLSVGDKDDPPVNVAAEFATGLTKYVGNLGHEFAIGTSTNIYGKLAACVQDTDDNKFYFYKVLASR
jgi:hypothetical protein